MYKRLFEEELLSYWDAVEKLGVEEQAEKIHDIWINWHNRNNANAVLRIIKNKKFQLVCRLQFYLKKILNKSNFGEKVIDLKNFENSMNKQVTIWRGGSGQYDKNYKSNLPFVSFTANKERVKTFSEYQGTHTSNAFMLDKNKQYWVVELKIPLKNILAYYDVGDDEVIVSNEDAKKAKLILQK